MSRKVPNLKRQSLPNISKMLSTSSFLFSQPAKERSQLRTFPNWSPDELSLSERCCARRQGLSIQHWLEVVTSPWAGLLLPSNARLCYRLMQKQKQAVDWKQVVVVCQLMIYNDGTMAYHSKLRSLMFMNPCLEEYLQLYQPRCLHHGKHDEQR